MPVAFLALIGTEYAAAQRGPVLTVPPIDTERPIEPLRDLLDTLYPDRTMMCVNPVSAGILSLRLPPEILEREDRPIASSAYCLHRQ